jgi:hypothetical protein
MILGLELAAVVRAASYDHHDDEMGHLIIGRHHISCHYDIIIRPDIELYMQCRYTTWHHNL